MSRLVVTRVITLGNGCAVVHKGSKNDNKLFLNIFNIWKYFENGYKYIG